MSPQPVTLFTALPLMWGEGDPGDVLSGEARRSPLLDGLDVRAIDAIGPGALGKDVLIVAQPRALAPGELVDLDAWVRGGGRTLIFDDPLLLWPSRYALGDARRAPPVGLLDPLLAHWGVTGTPADPAAVTRTIGGLTVAIAGTGQWRAPPNCITVDPLVIDCMIGKGRAIIVADADVLDAARAQSMQADNAAWFKQMIAALADNHSVARNSAFAWWPLLGAIAGFILAAGLFWRSRTRT